MNRDVVQLELFDEKISEVILENGKRYILRRNPVRAEEIAASRKSKLQSLRDFVAKKNEYLPANIVLLLQNANRTKARLLRPRIRQPIPRVTRSLSRIP